MPFQVVCGVEPLFVCSQVQFAGMTRSSGAAASRTPKHDSGSPEVKSSNKVLQKSDKILKEQHRRNTHKKEVVDVQHKQLLEAQERLVREVPRRVPVAGENDPLIQTRYSTKVTVFQSNLHHLCTCLQTIWHLWFTVVLAPAV